MHTHTPYGMAVSALEKGFLPLQQDAYQFHERLSYHEFEGVAVDIDERERLVTDLGNKNGMILAQSWPAHRGSLRPQRRG